MKKTQIVILDFGSQYTQLLARRVRENHVFAEVIDFHYSKTELKTKYPHLKGIILSGGPASVYEQAAFTIDPHILDGEIPILGVCYGLQLIADIHGGKVLAGEQQEFGQATCTIDDATSPLFKNIPNNSKVWMSHLDHIAVMPPNYYQIAHSSQAIAAIKHDKFAIYGIQFHAETTHSTFGKVLIANFIFTIAGAKRDWFMDAFISEAVTTIKNQVGSDEVILGLSGGVDSSVSAALISQAIGQQLTCIFVDTGLLRHNEVQQVMTTYGQNLAINIKIVDASALFYKALKGVSDPETKRKIIGKLFVDVFRAEAQKMAKTVKWLAQGTIYPDIIESSKCSHSSKIIKSHHNVGGLPEQLGLKLLEPLRHLFKDEVRAVGEQLKLPATIINRHPFPGPGLGVRIIGEVTKAKCDLLRAVDDIWISSLHEYELYDKVSQAHAILTSTKTVGVMGDNRTYEDVIALRAVNTIDFMTATATHLPWNFLDDVVNRIINKVKGVNRVVYDITSKPAATIEWE